MDKIKKEYITILMRHFKNRGEWEIWSKYFNKYKSFDKVIEMCLDPLNPKYYNDVNSRGIILWKKYNRTISTPFYIMNNIKGFTNYHIYQYLGESAHNTSKCELIRTFKN